MNQWISVKDRLPEDGQSVLIFLGNAIDVARIEKGISMAERDKMKSGEIQDELLFGGIPGKSAFPLKRSSVINWADEWGNNKVPYRWHAQYGPMDWFGQDVTHWMPLPKPPETE